MEAKNLDNLILVRCEDPFLIPRELVDQIKEKDYKTDDFLKNAFDNRFNPRVFLHILVDRDDIHGKIYGFLWADFDVMTNSIFVHSFSVDKSLWNKGKTLKIIEHHLRYIKETLKCKVRWLSNRPKLFEKMGFHKTKTVMFEVK